MHFRLVNKTVSTIRFSIQFARRIRMKKKMSDKKYNFDGKVALVTGSSSGIGAAAAIQFAKNGAKVTIHGRNQEALEKVAQKIQQVSGQEPVQVIGDLLEESTAVKLIEKTIEKFGRLDVLVNNAGIGESFTSIHDEQLLSNYDRIMGVNVRSVLQMIHLAAPYLEKTQGNIVNISSVAGSKPLKLIYSTSKAALNMATMNIAQELGPKGVRANLVSPGPVFTNFTSSYGMPDLFKTHEEVFKKMTALNRIGEPEDIANVIVFLASDDAKNITGSNFVSDGGTLVGSKPPRQPNGCHSKNQ